MRESPIRACDIGRYGIPALGLLVLLVGCGVPPVDDPQPRTVLRVATGGVMDPLAQVLTDSLPGPIPARIEHVTTDTLTENARLIEEGAIELAIVPANVAYMAHTQGWGELRAPHGKLRGVAVLSTIPLHLIATESSGIHTMADIRGKRVTVGNPGSTTALLARMTLEGLGLSFEDVDARWVAGDAAIEQLGTGEADAAFNRGNDPLPRVEGLMNVPGTRLIPVSGSDRERIRARHPFLRPTWIPAGIYGDHPEVGTIGMDAVIAASAELPDPLVYWITRALSESMTELVRSTHSFHQVNLERMHALPIPLHTGAARYYRERDLLR